MKNIFAIFLVFVILVYYVEPNDVERAALLAIKSQITVDPHGVLNSWNVSSSICEWQGVICGTRHSQRVVGLSLVAKGLVGTLSSFVGNLSFLHILSLPNNSFGGNIPPQLGHLSKLQILNLQVNNFEGPIPTNISHCLKLKALGLSHNHLSGTIPSQLRVLVNLEDLTLSKNQLMGDLLNSVVRNMSFLQLLSAGGNFFHGSIPQNIGEVLPRLTYFLLAVNNLSGTIPHSFYNLSLLKELELSNNQLQGTLPSDIGFRLSQLAFFQISENFFSGNLPTSFSNLTQLTGFSVYNNNFTGKLEFSAIRMPTLTYFDVSFNYLGTGEANDLSFLTTLLNCSYLSWVNCGMNNFGGSLPSFSGNFSAQTYALQLGFNKIGGGIPSWLFNLFSLQQLMLRNNYLTGQLSPEIGKLTKMQYFDCDANYLTGRIPDSIGNLSYLSVLYLSNNSFEGTIPSSLGRCKNLIHLSITRNNLTGPLPSLLFQASSMLVELKLNHNNLQGIIPAEIEQLTNLVLLDLSSNAFSGHLPTSLSRCIDLVSLYMGGNFFTGSIPQSFQSLTGLSEMYLSNNNLSGPIPQFFTNFSLVVLDLAYNNFEGEVPVRGIFANLSGLRIIGNKKLCGGIPELHLPKCSLSFNKNGVSKERGKLSVAVILIIAVACLVIAVAIVSSVYLLLCSKRKKSQSSHNSALNLKEPFLKVSYDTLLKATDGFSEANMLGTGHFGFVYKGILDAESNLVVAVKVVHLEQSGATKSFMKECETLRNTRHRNLLRVITACSSTDFQGNDFKALVYEFMPNGNLHQWIHYDQQQKQLSLLQRVSIAIDVASALDYLHNNCDVPIIHCDLKPSNILLDNDLVAHVGDFGLARFHLHPRASDSSTIAIKGTVGYAAPEYGLGREVSKEGDIYSFGIVLLELITAKSPIDTMFEGDLELHKYAKSALSDQLIKVIDPQLLNDCQDTSIGMKCIGSVMEIGVKCSAESPQNRMKIEDAIAELQVTRDIWLKELRIIGTRLSEESGWINK